MNVAGILLAAGAGRRLGMPKALLRVDGQLAVDRRTALLLSAGCSPVLTVLGAASDDVLARAILDDVTILINPGWDSGMGSSLRAALSYLSSSFAAFPDLSAPFAAFPDLPSPFAASPDLPSPFAASPDLSAPFAALPEISASRAGSSDDRDAAAVQAGLSQVDAAIVILVDQPGITAEAIRRVAGAATDLPVALVMAGYGGRRGHPVLLGRAHWAAIIEAAQGDQGARAYLREHAGEVIEVDCGDVGNDRDIDTREDIEA